MMLQDTSHHSECQGPLASGWKALSKSIQETEDSRAASVQALMNIVTDSHDELLADRAVDYLLAELNDADFPQDLNQLLAVTLDLQGLSPAAACKRIRYVLKSLDSRDFLFSLHLPCLQAWHSNVEC